MKSLRVFALVLLSACSLLLANSARAQSDGNVNAYSQVTYDEQTGYVLAEGGAQLFVSRAEIITGADWQLAIELYGPSGFITTSSEYLYGYDDFLSAYASTYADESGYGEYTAYATPTMMAGSLDYLGFAFYYAAWQQGNSWLTFMGGPYFPGMPCWDTWMGIFPWGPCYEYWPDPYLQWPYDLGRAEFSWYVEPPCAPIFNAGPKQVTCGGTTYEANATVGATGGTAPIWAVQMSTSSDNTLMIDLLGGPFNRSLCPDPGYAGVCIFGQNFKAHTYNDPNTGEPINPTGSIVWEATVTCSGVTNTKTITRAQAISCQ